MSLIEINNDRVAKAGLDIAIAFCRAMASDQLEREDVIAVVADLVDPILNVVIHAQTMEASVEEMIAAVIAFYQRHQAAWAWVMGPLSQPITLPHHLKQHGFFLLEAYPGMYFDLANALPVYAPSEIEIQEAPSDDDLHEWIKPERAAFTTSDQGESYRKLNAMIPHGEGSAFRHYVGYYEHQPVSAITLFIHNDAVMIHNLATQPAYGRRGFGSALTVHVMNEAKKLGIKHCFLDSSKKGMSVYQRLGFQIYANYHVYAKR